MRSEILKAHIVKWNLADMHSVHIHFPEINSSSNHFLSKVTYTIDGDATNKVYNLKDSWPINGGDLAFKPAEGLKIRRLLGLGLDQEIKIVTTKELPSIPSPQSTTTSLNNSLASLNESALFYNSICEGSPVSSTFSLNNDNNSVELYHAQRVALQEYLNRPLPHIPSEEYNVHNSEVVRILRRRFTIHSTILEDSSEDLLDSLNNINNSGITTLVNSRTSTLLPEYTEQLANINPYTGLPTY